jgi:predicted transcriptional regulator YdeE
MAAWWKFFVDRFGDKVEHKAYPHLHTIYYNFVDPTGPRLGYDMLLGYVTEDGSAQSDSSLTTITIPSQNYKYKKVTGDPKVTLGPVWKEINAMPKEEVARTYQYDMEMFSEDGNEVTVAVSVV